MRQFVIGDIHGAYRALIQVLERAGFDYDNDKLISVGDVADGWPEMPECIEELKKIKNLVYLKGNHDEWAAKFLEKIPGGYDPEYDAWMMHGGGATKTAYLDMPGLRLRMEHIEFLRSAPHYYLDEKNRLFMHAGIFPKPGTKMHEHNSILKEGLEIEDLERIMKERPDSFFWDRYLWDYAYAGRTKPTKHFHEVYIGHTPTINYPQSNGSQSKPMNRGNVWNMDTGCCYTGAISMMEINTKELFQSDRAMELYPDHPGRNRKPFNQM